MSKVATRSAGTADPANAVLQARGVFKTYTLGKNKLEVLHGVDFAVQRGEFVALRGASGAGKSTLLHLLGGLDRPGAGTLRFDAVELNRLSDDELARLRNRRIGFVFQAYHLLPELDALENVCLPARLQRRPAAEVEKIGRDLLGRVGLAARMDHKPLELSGGEQQRVAIARALINQPELILADEPTGNLDSLTGDGIIRLLCELRAERAATLVIATHDAHVASQAPRVVEMVDGQIVESGGAGRP